ncbi:MAG: winged helix-turn-helix domain-containing protein [Eubacteriales bacterium]|nr:winged helix-turn-helix domain-containing protein [Eubacteriales bacterium]
MDEERKRRKQELIESYNLARPIMTVLGDEVRQEILLALMEAEGQGGLRVGDIQQRCHVSRSSVSHHLKVLLQADIISVRHEGTKNYYYIDLNRTAIRPVMRFWQMAGPIMDEYFRPREDEH